MSLDAVREKARQVVRKNLIKAVSNNNTTPLTKAQEQQIDKAVLGICQELDRTKLTVPAYQQGLMLVGVNLDLLKAKALSVPILKLVTEDTSGLKALMEEDVEERKITNEFAASEICEKCGLPKSNTKMNINRLDVEDEVFGKQFDYVFNDVCTCGVEKTKDETVEEKKARLEEEEKKRKEQAKQSSVLSLWEEQNDLAEEEERLAQVPPARRERE